jgi:hypothetical protein
VPSQHYTILDLPLHEAARRAGDVIRFHQYPYIIGRPTVAEHVYNGLALLYSLHEPGEPSPELVKAFLFHDLGEGETGDIPHPAKRVYPELGKASTRAESHVCTTLLGADLEAALSTEDLWWLKTIDMLELMFYVRDQRRLGNVGMDIVFDAGVRVLYKMLEDSGDSVRKVHRAFQLVIHEYTTLSRFVYRAPTKE